MMRNIELKAVVGDIAALKERIKKLAVQDTVIIYQNDTFFNVREGRLKLRQFKDGDAELIFYNRPDEEGPKLCSYQKCDIVPQNVDSLSNVLCHALGVNGVVKKTRELYLVGQTRIHVDTVEELGNFMELEVVLRPEQSLQEGHVIINDLMNKLGISKEHLLKGAYRDLLDKK